MLILKILLSSLDQSSTYLTKLYIIVWITLPVNYSVINKRMCLSVNTVLHTYVCTNTFDPMFDTNFMNVVISVTIVIIVF